MVSLVRIIGISYVWPDTEPIRIRLKIKIQGEAFMMMMMAKTKKYVAFEPACPTGGVGGYK